MIIYFFWRQHNTEDQLFNPDIILRYHLKFYAIYLLELIIESVKLKSSNPNQILDFDVNDILTIYFDLIFKLNIDTSSIKYISDANI